MHWAFYQGSAGAGDLIGLIMQKPGTREWVDISSTVGESRTQSEMLLHWGLLCLDLEVSAHSLIHSFIEQILGYLSATFWAPNLGYKTRSLNLWNLHYLRGLNISECMGAPRPAFSWDKTCLKCLCIHPKENQFPFFQSRHEIIQAFTGQVGIRQNRNLDWTVKGKAAVDQA